MQDRQLRRTGLTTSDLEGFLRRDGTEDLADVRYLVFESRGQISVVPQSAPGTTRPTCSACS